MPAQIEIRSASPNQFHFELHDDEGAVLLRGLPGDSKIMVQNEVLHLRKAVGDPDNFVPHTTDSGKHFLVLRDHDGSVLARSVATEDTSSLAALQARIVALSPQAALVDRSKPHRVRHPA